MILTGIKGRAETLVEDRNSAKEMKSGTLPVFSTPSLSALVEESAWKSVKDEIPEDSATVGIKLSLEHLSATPIGMKVWAETELIEIDGRRLVFSFSVFDEKGLIGKGEHERFIINADRFLSKAYDKLK